jgi:hypothetical protein
MGVGTGSRGGGGGSGGTNGIRGSGGSGGLYGGGTASAANRANGGGGGGGGGALAYTNGITVSPGTGYQVVVGSGGVCYASGGSVHQRGGSGAVRIIWGNGRSFPTTAVTQYNQTLN